MTKHTIRSMTSRTRRAETGFSNQTALILIAACYPLGIASMAVMVNTASSYSGSGALTAFERNPTQQTITEEEAKSVIQEWWNVRPRVFASPYDSSAASSLVSSGPLWTDLTKSDGPVAWLQNNGQYYTYHLTNIESVISFDAQDSERPSIVVRVRSQDTLHGPGINKPSTGTNNFRYTFAREDGRWKIWNYEKI